MNIHAALATLLMLLCINASHASGTSRSVEEFRLASERFSAMVAEAEKGAGGTGDKLDSDEFMSLVDILSDEDAMLSPAPSGPADLALTLEICGIANKNSMELLLFGLKSMVESRPDVPAKRLLGEVMAANNLRFQAPLEKLQPFLVRCLAGQISPMGLFVASLPPEQFTEVRRNGLLKSRKGILMVYLGALSGASDEAYKESYREALLAVVAETAHEFVPMLTVSQRQSVVDVAAGLRFDSDARFQAHVDEIVRAFGNEECSGLCLIE